MSETNTAWRPDQRIRPIAIGIVWRGDEILVAQVCDDDGRIDGWRPLGGGLEFGERSSETLKREFAEELNTTIAEPILLTAMENHYEHQGVRGHEIVFVFETSFCDPKVYQQDEFKIVEGSLTILAEWKSLASFERGTEVLYPDDLLEALVAQRQNR